MSSVSCVSPLSCSSGFKSFTWLSVRSSVSFFNESHLDKEVSPAIEFDELAALTESSSKESEESQVKRSRLSGSVISNFLADVGSHKVQQGSRFRSGIFCYQIADIAVLKTSRRQSEPTLPLPLLPEQSDDGVCSGIE